MTAGAGIASTVDAGSIAPAASALAVPMKVRREK
jgi:hypothetical protein